MNESKYQLFNEQIEQSVQFPNKKVVSVFESEYELLELNSLRDEICRCIFCGLPQASLTLTNTLLELAMRVSIAYAKVAGVIIDENLLDSLGGKKKTGKKHSKNTLSNNINILFAMGLITEEQKELLHEYRKEYRNNFAHARLERIEKETMSFECINIPKKSYMQISKNLLELPMLYGLSLQMSAENTYIDYFLCVDNIIRNIYSKIIQYGK